MGSPSVRTCRDVVEADAEGVESPVTGIAEHEVLLMVWLATRDTCLALHTLPRVGLYHCHELHTHVQA